MSSPRKYSSPYLSNFSGISSTTKVKKRSKISVRANESGQNEESAEDLDQRNDTSIADDAIFDPSCGDTTSQKILTEINKPVAVSCDETLFVREGGCEHERHEVADAVSAEHQLEQKKYDNGDNTCSETLELDPAFGTRDVEERCTAEKLTNADNSIGDSLKSILKKPSPYVNKMNMKFGSETDQHRKSGKGSKQKNLKHINTREQVASIAANRLMSKNSNKCFAPTAPSSKKEVQKSLQLATNAKFPRKSSKSSPMSRNVEKEEPTLTSLPLLRKSVRFSNRIDVYPVPYESRAGTRACDWQRNMLEQRVQTFRQLMKDVVSSEELDLFGTGMLFPGYSYHVPNPHFALRGRARNFKM